MLLFTRALCYIVVVVVVDVGWAVAVGMIVIAIHDVRCCGR